MSWDASIEHPDESEFEFEFESESWNYTHNCNQMMRNALEAIGELEKLGERHLYNLDGISVAEVVRIFEPALLWWRGHCKLQAKHNAPNGWGDEPSAYRFWRVILVAAKRSSADGYLRLSG